MNPQKLPLTEQESQKVSRDLQFIRALAIACAPAKCRLIISGGYAVDGALGQITRPHRDLDFQIFCQKADAAGQVNKLFQVLLEDYPDLQLTDEGREDYYHLFKLNDQGSLKAEIYYIQTFESPFDTVKITVRKDGTQSQPGKFDTIVSNLEDVLFESISPAEILKDKLAKMKSTKEADLPKHNQDVENLQKLFS